jgi:hypothetical protein
MHHGGMRRRAAVEAKIRRGAVKPASRAADELIGPRVGAPHHFCNTIEQERTTSYEYAFNV